MKAIFILAVMTLLAVPAGATERAADKVASAAALQAQIDVLRQQVAALQKQVNGMQTHTSVVCFAIRCA